MSSKQMSEMYSAIYNGDCKKIDALVHAGLSVDTRVEGDEWNFLHMALVSVTLTPDPDVIRHLIALGVDINAKDRRLWTPVHFAVRTGDSLIVKLLIDSGAEIDAVNDEGVSPLHQCLIEYPCNLEIAEMLLAAGADLDNDRGSGTVRNYANVISGPDNPDIDGIIELLDKYTKK